MDASSVLRPCLHSRSSSGVADQSRKLEGSHAAGEYAIQDHHCLVTRLLVPESTTSNCMDLCRRSAEPLAGSTQLGHRSCVWLVRGAEASPLEHMLFCDGLHTRIYLTLQSMDQSRMLPLHICMLDNTPRKVLCSGTRTAPRTST